MSKEITIYDIAKEFNVSPSTVSRALKGHKSIGKTTTELIQVYARENGYQINSVAANLRSKKTFSIGVIVPWINRPFISSVISGVETVASSQGYNVIIAQTRDDYNLEINNVNAMFQSRIEGLIVSLAMESKSYDHFDSFLSSHIPVVFVDRAPEKTGVDRIIIDNYEASYKATKHLIDQGCKKLAHIGGSQSRFIYRERKRGFLAALEDNGIPVKHEWIKENRLLNGAEAEEIGKYLLSLEDRPDGFYCTNDTSAVAIIQVAKSKLIKIPQELKIVGFNDDPVASIIEPKLTTVSHPAVQMGQIAAQHILNKEKQKVETVILPTELIIRGSTVEQL